MKGKTGWIHRNVLEISECESVIGKNGENEKIGGNKSKLGLFINEKFDEMNVFAHSIELFPFYMSNYIKLAMYSFMAGSQLHAS